MEGTERHMNISSSFLFLCMRFYQTFHFNHDPTAWLKNHSLAFSHSNLQMMRYSLWSPLNFLLSTCLLKNEINPADLPSTRFPVAKWREQAAYQWSITCLILHFCEALCRTQNIPRIFTYKILSQFLYCSASFLLHQTNCKVVCWGGVGVVPSNSWKE